MIFVDTNVIMYAVGKSHPLKKEARDFFRSIYSGARVQPCTSAEVLQELMHAYIPVGRISTLDNALRLVDSCISTIWPVEPEDVRTARLYIDQHAGLGARDLLHLAMCRRRNTNSIKTFDLGLKAAFGKSPRKKDV